MSIYKKLLFIILILLLLILFLFIFFIFPDIKEIKTLSENVRVEKENIEKNYQSGKTLNQIKKELKENEDKTQILESIFLEEGGELEFITTLEKLAQKYNLKQEINLSGRGDFNNSYKTMPIGIILEGNFDNLLKYLNEVEKFKFYLNIDSFNLSSGNNDDLRVTLLAKTYWKK